MFLAVSSIDTDLLLTWLLLLTLNKLGKNFKVNPHKYYCHLSGLIESAGFSIYN